MSENLDKCFTSPDASFWTLDGGRACTNLANQALVSNQGGYVGGLTLVQGYTAKAFSVLVGDKVLSESPLGSALLSFCSDVPNACTPNLSQYCSSIPIGLITDKEDINSKFCGCIHPPNYDLGGITTIPPQCLPSCQRTGVIPLFSSSNGDKIQCNDSVCVLDNVSVNASNSKVGSVSYQQVCGNCSLGTCRCIISASGGVSLKALAEVLTDPQSLLTFCGSNTQCFQDDKEVECKSIIPDKPSVHPQVKWAVLGALLILALTILFIWILRRGKAISS